MALPDFSYAGYQFGERTLPAEAAAHVFNSHSDGSVDVSAELQLLIDTLGEAGGGVLEIAAGLYRLDRPLLMRHSHVVLRGAGREQTKLWFRDGGGTTSANRANILLSPETNPQLQESSGWRVAEPAQANDRVLTLADTAGLALGDDILIAWQISAAFRAEHGSEDYWNHAELDQYKVFFRRTISDIQGNQISFKTPLRYDISLRDVPVVQQISGYLEGVGVQDLSLTNAVSLQQAWQGFDKSILLQMRYCQHCWLTGLSSYDQSGDGYEVRSHGIAIEQSVNVTLANIRMANAQHLGDNGNGYLFQLSAANEVLIQDSQAINGRHGFTFSWDFGASGNVLSGVTSEGGRICDSYREMQRNACTRGGSDFHHALSIANLIEYAQINDSLQVGNRHWLSSGAGQTGTLNVFWNIQGQGDVYAYNQGPGFVVGTGANVKVTSDLDVTQDPERYLAYQTQIQDYTELLGEAEQLVPQSLYRAQLERRLSR
ncbi:hypothetical protein [Gilvimarinus sp. DA14]|uniref:hypothetical protein n=1 Tax=Gilvimarinus sp. DA14 TaxID=2956798 RepID=UPI0020B6EB8D|nr:hypothetical protein [Gilvimarinus sp. DA14]UTF59750.1 hypothetical protein NHM04_14950 [Gilvimarinus sp. DA14]